LRLDDLGWTEAVCPSRALFRQEQRMQDSLATVERFEVSGYPNSNPHQELRYSWEAALPPKGG